MSKKNRNKNRFRTSGVTAEESIAPAAKETVAKKPENDMDEDLKREFRNLGLTILFILILLGTLYYYDQKNQILDQITSKLFSLF